MSKLTRITIIALAIFVIALAFGIGYQLGGRIPQGSPEGLAVIDRAWNILYRDYVDPSKLDPQKLSQAAIEAMIKTLDDPYTTYLDPQKYRLSISGLHGEFEGIGATVGIRNDRVTVIAPIAGTPADRAGIKPGDIILAVDGKSTDNLTVNEVVILIRGARGTSVKLTVQHTGQSQPVDIEIIRDTIKISSVYSEMRGDIAYINITQFVDQTDTELTAVLEGLGRQAANGIIIDLRRNPGGLLETVIRVASHFLKQGIVVQVKSNQQQLATYEVRSGEYYTDLPLVILVDEFSASGSEVLSGALQDYGRATIAGARTFGKGSVNILRQLDGAGIYVTTARWLTPNGRLIEGKGIDPDIQLDPKTDAIQWAVDYLKSK